MYDTMYVWRDNMARRKTQQEFVEEVKEKNPNNIKIVGEYQNNKTKVEVLFLDCNHTRFMAPIKLIAGQGCGHSDCIGKSISRAKINKRKQTIDSELESMGYKLLSKFKGTQRDIKVLNTKCGHTYTANANNILMGSGCPTCHGIKDTKIFENELRERYGDEYTVLEEYKNGLTKIDVKHNHCGHTWKATPKDLLRDRRCPNCYLSKGESYIRDFLEKREVKYEREYRFEDCRNINPLPFDFAIFVNDEMKLIEFDGSQHFGKSNYWGKKNSYGQIKENDNIDS